MPYTLEDFQNARAGHDLLYGRWQLYLLTCCMVQLGFPKELNANELDYHLVEDALQPIAKKGFKEPSCRDYVTHPERLATKHMSAIQRFLQSRIEIGDGSLVEKMDQYLKNHSDREAILDCIFSLKEYRGERFGQSYELHKNICGVWQIIHGSTKSNDKRIRRCVVVIEGVGATSSGEGVLYAHMIGGETTYWQGTVEEAGDVLYCSFNIVFRDTTRAKDKEKCNFILHRGDYQVQDGYYSGLLVSMPPIIHPNSPNASERKISANRCFANNEKDEDVALYDNYFKRRTQGDIINTKRGFLFSPMSIEEIKSIREKYCGYLDLEELKNSEGDCNSEYGLKDWHFDRLGKPDGIEILPRSGAQESRDDRLPIAASRADIDSSRKVGLSQDNRASV
ncbi:MAG: hypothetical protein GDA50_06930 [Alphaproteobacteria bacterium GM202ARS2]|nr:hypothetical protein [Alphaproteobacteria bacterium GM202ARS2]